ncbi:MAG: hypothetical protein QOF37_2569, partial [Thermoleophilaceae bacterium]|nr:hypothetical protein [Thermoleophilaceae bacterium]
MSRAASACAAVVVVFALALPAGAMAGDVPAHARAAAETGVGPRAARAAVSPATARARAAAILRDRRFHGGPAPRPLHGVFTAIGNAAGAVIDPIRKLVDRITSGFPGGAPVFWL